MAVWEFRVVYKNGDRGWENVWHIDVGSDVSHLEDVASDLEDFARTCLLSLYTVERIAYRPAGTTNEFIVRVVDLLGLLTIGSNIPMPLFNVIRVLLESTSGKPGEKLLRGSLVTADVVDDSNHISTTLHGIIEGAAVTLFNAVEALGYHVVMGSADRVAFSPTTENTVAMRQLHRKRRKSLV